MRTDYFGESEMQRNAICVLLCLAICLGVFATPRCAGAADPAPTGHDKTCAANQSEPLTEAEIDEYAQMQTDAEQMELLDTAGGAEAGTGTLVLATIGALVVLGVILMAA